MANVAPINVKSINLASAGLQVGGRLETASIAPMAAVPAPVAASPVDVAATGAATAIHTKMTAMHGELAPKGPEMQAKTAAAASGLQEQDAQNASPLKDLASAVPSSGSGGSGATTMGGSSGQGHIQAVDHTFKMDGGNNTTPGNAPPHPCTGRDKWDSGLSILGGAGETIAGGAGVVGGWALAGAGAAAEVPTVGTSTAAIAAGVGVAGTGVYGITDGIKKILDGIDDLGKCQ